MDIVWRGLTQDELDAAYNQAAYAPNMQEVLARLSAQSEVVRQRIGAPRRFSYGQGENDSLDVYSPSSFSSTAPINIFVHGGAWRAGEAKDYAFPAELFVNAGAHFVAIDFDCVQDHDGDLLSLADQVKRAIAWIAVNAPKFGGDPTQLHLSAHSSGAHLASVALTTNWPAEFALPTDLIKSALLCSGIYDLQPVRLSARSSYVTITEESEQVLSAMRHLEKITTPLIIAHGSKETPEFQRHAREFAAALQARNHPAELRIGQDLNHFEVLETLADPDGILGRAALRLMGCGN